MFEWNLRCIFCCTLLQVISAELADDGRALFFGVPVPLRSSNGNSSLPVHTLLKSTFLMADSNERQDQNLLYTTIPKEEGAKEGEVTGVARKLETDPDPAISVDPTEKGLYKSEDSGVENEFSREDPLVFIPNLLQTEESTSSTQRQPPNGVALASIIRSAVALTRPLTSQRPTSFQYLFTKSNRDPLRDVISLVEGLMGRMGNTIAKQNPIDFLNLIDNMQNAVDRISGDGECTVIVELMDQTMITLKELMQMMSAVQKLGEMWSTVNISTLGKCVKKSGAVTAGTVQTSENENIATVKEKSNVKAMEQITS